MNEIRNLLIGIDFGKENTQVCYYDRKAEEPLSLSLKAGETMYEVPTSLLKRSESSGYSLTSKEEIDALEESSSLIRNLYDITGRAEPVRLSGEDKQPWELTAGFLQGILRYLGVSDIVRSISALAIAAEELTPERVGNLKKAASSLGFDESAVYLLDYDECFFYHVMTQKKEIPARNTAWYSFSGNTCCFRKMILTTTKRPVRVSIGEAEEISLPEEPEKRDEAFAIFVQKTLGQEIYSSIQITGEGFDRAWAVHSTRILCFGKRKVYYGNNLYARGACAMLKEKLENHALKNYLFESRYLVKSEVGMHMRVMGANAYYTMIRSGSNWYECKCSCEILLDDVNELVFEVTMENEADIRRIAMKLPGLPDRPPKASRLRLDLEYISREKCRILVTDLGFGEMFPSSGLTWTETVEW
ncbi:MAG: hypothetical protein IJ123_08230 [Blautia sp.]|nr:hypothetical protein [Blautia sp.]